MATAGYPTRVPGRHPLLEKCAFEQLHRNGAVEARPQALHFGGFQIHQQHTQILRVTNIAPSSVRVALIGPTTPYFHIGVDKKGLLAPGMSEEIEVAFTPHEWRYYYDTVKVFCGDHSEHLVVPLHAYPSANDIVLPSIVDFGRVPIGTQRTRVIPLSCKIPIQFEFEIMVLQEHPDFQVTPMSGVIPPDGTADVVITFLPTKHRTARTELQFNVAQFDFNPVKVAVVGSCHPDLTREEVLQRHASELVERNSAVKQERLAGMVGKLEEKRNRAPVSAKPPLFEDTVAERTLEGVKIPVARTDQQATNFVLNQTAGKLPLKDLLSSIREQSEAAQERRRRASTSADSEVEVDDDPQTLELRYEMRYREVEKYDKQKELRSSRATGMDQMTEQAIKAASAARLGRHTYHIKQRMATDVSRVESVLANSRVAVPSAYKPASSPQWDENANDTFSVRLQVIDRFVRVGSKCLMRVRAQRRSEKLRQALKVAGVTDRESCRAWVDVENKAAASGTRGCSGSGGDASGAAGALSTEEGPADGALEAMHIPKDFVLPIQIPVSQSGLSVDERLPMEVAPIGNFEEFRPAAINPRLDWKVMQYEKYSIPPAAAYMRLHKDRHRLHAALEERLIRGERGDALDGAEHPISMPDSCLLPPEHDALSLLVPDIQCRTYVALPEFTECDPEFGLSQQVPLLGPLATEPLLLPELMSIETPWLDSWRQTRQLADPFQFFDPLPGNFAEAGGPLGPSLGCDAGGQRLSFLPVGGFERDLLSDTDDDETDEFHMPAPGNDAYQQACAGLDVGLTSELWRNEIDAEESRKALCTANGFAVRGVLGELNEVLDPALKVFLG